MYVFQEYMICKYYSDLTMLFFANKTNAYYTGYFFTRFVTISVKSFEDVRCLLGNNFVVMLSSPRRVKTYYGNLSEQLYKLDDKYNTGCIKKTANI